MYYATTIPQLKPRQMTASSNARVLYRHLLRELPPLTAQRTTLHHTLRQSFTSPQHSSSIGIYAAQPPGEHAKQFLKYLQSQRSYVALLERYNPALAAGGEMDLAEHARLTARRVGLDMPTGPGRGA